MLARLLSLLLRWPGQKLSQERDSHRNRDS